jgi:xanthine dehydrogenase small subunit
MRDHLLLYVNGKPHRVSGNQAFIPLSSYLRYEQQATGTKVVCEEGDCGACTVLLGKVQDGEIAYQPVNSCIQYMYQLDCTHVITIEGLKVDGELNAVQESMVNCHGAQCGYCTPGFVVAMCSMFDQKCSSVNRQDIKDALTGNLCRCTGYESIISAGLEVSADKVLKLRELYPSEDMVKSLSAAEKQPVAIQDGERKIAIPVELEYAVKFKASNPGTVIVSGGTDVCVQCNKRGIEPQSIMSLCNLPGMDQITVADEEIKVGARVTLTELEGFYKETLPEMHEMLRIFGSPQIKNAGTLAGNIANASPIADTLPYLFAMDASVELAGLKGSRLVKMRSLYKGYKNLDWTQDEMIASIRIPLLRQDEVLKLYKVSKRKNLDISTFTAAIRMKTAGGRISAIDIAYGGVGPVVLMLPKTADYLIGKENSLENFVQAGEIAKQEITPISDVRGSSDFRYHLAGTILERFFYETADAGELVCQ